MITFPANPHSAPCCRLDISLLSARHQGAERHRSASKVIWVRSLVRIWLEETLAKRWVQKKKKKKLRKSLYKYAGDIELTFGEFMFDFMLDVEDDSEKIEKFFIQE